jgi:hypothetical protein
MKMSKHTTDQNAELRERAEEFRRKYPDRKQSTEVLKYVGEATSLVADLLAALSTTEERLRECDKALELGLDLVCEKKGWGTIDRMEGWRIYEDADKFREAALAAQQSRPTEGAESGGGA